MRRLHCLVAGVSMIFLVSAVAPEEEGVPSDLMSAVQSLFVSMDEDDNGSLSISEFKRGYSPFAKAGKRTRVLPRIFAATDADGDGSVSWDEFRGTNIKVLDHM